MIVEDAVIQDIKSLGLNTYEVKIWTALLSRGVSTAGELSDIANVPRSRSYDVLESLEKKGFVVMKLGKPIKYLAVPPKEALEGVKTQIERKTSAHLNRIDSQSFGFLINKLQKLHETSAKSTGNVMAVLKGTRNIQKHTEYLSKSAKKEIIFVDDKMEQEHLSSKPHGSKVKHFVGPRLRLFDDDDTIIFPLGPRQIHPDYDVGIWIKNKQTTKFLKNLLNYASS